jgi:tripartite-type tricarboxylate transporter receptor subunit TctC
MTTFVVIRYAAQLVAAVAAATVPAVAHAASAPAHRPAGDYPNRPIRIVDGYAAGAMNDFAARLVGQHLSERTGQPVVVENRPGATGNIGAALAAKAAPDGYTLFIALSSSMAASVTLFPDVGYDLLKDFAYISTVGSGTYVLVAGPTVPAKSLSALIALAKAKPGHIRYGSSGVGGPLHLGMEVLNRSAGIEMTHVPYKSSALMAPAMVADEVHVGFSSLASSLPLIKAGRLMPLAVTGAKRTNALPDTPTVAESGFPGFNVTPWYGLLAPAATPAAIVKELNSEINKILLLPDVQAKFAVQGVEAAGSTPERFKEIMQAEVELWAKVIRDGNIKAK